MYENEQKLREDGDDSTPLRITGAPSPDWSDPGLQEETLMRGAEHQVAQKLSWRDLFDEHHANLAVVAEMLLRCRFSPEKILTKALAALEVSPREETFKHALRAVVETTIAHNRETADSSLKDESPGPVKCGFPGSSQIGKLPWAERAVYLLHGVLRYSCRETALLLGMSNANIDQLYKFAAKRIAY